MVPVIAGCRVLRKLDLGVVSVLAGVITSLLYELLIVLRISNIRFFYSNYKSVGINMNRLEVREVHITSNVVIQCTPKMIALL